jgi:hypothetical protein
MFREGQRPPQPPNSHEFGYFPSKCATSMSGIASGIHDLQRVSVLGATTGNVQRTSRLRRIDQLPVLINEGGFRFRPYIKPNRSRHTPSAVANESDRSSSAVSTDGTRRGCEKIGPGTFATADFPGFSPFRLGASPIFFHSFGVYLLRRCSLPPCCATCPPTPPFEPKILGVCLPTAARSFRSNFSLARRPPLFLRP